MYLLCPTMINFDAVERRVKGPLNYKYIMTSVDVYESIHHKIITC